MQKLIQVLWPSFLIAGIAEAVFFTVINPQELYLFGKAVELLGHRNLLNRLLRLLDTLRGLQSGHTLLPAQCGRSESSGTYLTAGATPCPRWPANRPQSRSGYRRSKPCLLHRCPLGFVGGESAR